MGRLAEYRKALSTELKSAVKRRNTETFRVEAAEGNLLPWNRWATSRPNETSILTDANGRTEVIIDHPRSTYLVCGGTDHDFRTLGNTSGVEIGGPRAVRISSSGQVRGELTVKLMLLEFDARRRRIGEKSVSLGSAQVIYLSDETEFVLPTIYLNGRGELTLTHLSMNLMRSSGQETLQTLDVPALRHAVREVQSVASSLQQMLLRPSMSATGQEPEVWAENPYAIALSRASLMHVPFYEGVRGRKFENETQAIADFVSKGMFSGLSCTPLIEVSRLPREVQLAWRNGDVPEILSFLSLPRTQLGELSEFFDASLIPLSVSRKVDHPGGAVGWFMDNARADDFLPTQAHAVRWNDFLEAIRAATDSELESVRAREPRITYEWDWDGERRFKEQARRERDSHKPLISVIMPVWNREFLVSQAIESVLSQTYANFELVVVDDGSDDRTLEIVNEFMAKDDRVRVHSGGHRGVSHARNLGVEQASGELVAFLDSDNRWEPDYLEMMEYGIRMGAETGARFAYCGLELELDGRRAFRAFVGGRKDLEARNHIDLNVLIALTEEVRSIGGFDESLRRWVDHDLALRLGERSEPYFVPVIGCIYDDSRSDKERITTSESDNWQWVVLGKALQNWEDHREANVQPGLTSIVMPMYGQRHMTLRAVKSALGAVTGEDVEVVIVDNGSDFETSWHVRAAFAGDPRVVYLRLPLNMNFAIGSNMGALASRGEYLFFLNNDTECDGDWLTPLKERISDPAVHGVQPLLLYPDNSIQTAGTVFVSDNSLPVHFLAGLPPEDAVSLKPVHAITGAAMYLRRADFMRHRGFDPLFVNGMEDIDYCLRAAAGEARFKVEPDAVIYHHESRTPGRGDRLVENRRLFMQRWFGKLPASEQARYEPHGFNVAHLGSDGLPIPAPRVLLARNERGGERWGIKISSIGGPNGRKWGDTWFAESLANSLENYGKTVVTYRHGANQDTSKAMDDINLVLRGIDRVAPIPGQVNILWVISHPEDVTLAEVEGFDLVFSASKTWAQRMGRNSSRPIEFLPQATDGSRFNRHVTDTGVRRGPLFVGSVHPGRRRGIVEDAVLMNLPITVIGGGWKGVLPDGILESERIDNRDLAAAYRSATRVLADHWPEMAEEGFIQNRVFDAVAAGCRVVSDPVAGLELFGGAVQPYHSPAELAFLLSPKSDLAFPSDAELALIADRIVEEHSFDARAKQLIDSVNRLLRPRI